MSNIDIEQRALRAKELFLSGYNCCQSVVLAFEDITALEPTLATAPMCALSPLFSLAFSYWPLAISLLEYRVQITEYR